MSRGTRRRDAPERWRDQDSVSPMKRVRCIVCCIVHGIGRATSIAALAVFAVGAADVQLAAQGPGPLTPTKPPEIVRIPTNPVPEKAPIPPEEIIRRFAAQEDEYARALGNYTYRRTVRLEELGENGKPTGQAEVVTEIVIADDGSRRQRPVSRSDSTLRVLGLEPDALETLGRMATFPFGESQASNYNFVYQAAEAVDDLMTYVFRVTPETDRSHARLLLRFDLGGRPRSGGREKLRQMGERARRSHAAEPAVQYVRDLPPAGIEQVLDARVHAIRRLGQRKRRARGSAPGSSVGSLHSISGGKPSSAPAPAPTATDLPSKINSLAARGVRARP